MTAFVTLEELSRFVGTDYRFDLNAELVLEAACQSVRDFLSQQIDYVEADEVVFLPRTTRETLKLPQLPVVEIVSVQVENDDAVLDADQYELQGRSYLRRVDDYWYKDYRVTVVYSHGWATTMDDVDEAGGIYRVPSPIRQKALELAASGLTVSATSGGGTVTSETIGNYSYTTAESATTGMVITEAEGMSIVQYRQEDVA